MKGMVGNFLKIIDQSLLNIDLKLITKVLAKRLAKVIGSIVHESQKCVPGRKMTDIIHLN